MKAIERYTRALLRREENRPRFDDALISSRAWRYAAYRLRYPGIRAVLRLLLHLVEIMILFPLLEGAILAPILIVRTAMYVLSALWWGGLEEMREEVRASVKRKEWSRVRRVIDAWLGISGLSATVLTIAGTTIILLTARSSHLSAMDLEAYLLACVLRQAMDMVARTYHSGVYAFRRVFRPLWTIVLTDFLDVFLILWFWGAGFQFWSMSLSLVIVGLLRTVLTIAFCRRTYRDSAVPPLQILHIPSALKKVRNAHLGRFLLHGAANLGTQIDGILLISVLVFVAKQSDGFSFAMVLYLLRPLLAMGSAWARPYYFDFKLLMGRYGPFVQRRFERFMKRVAGVLGLLIGGLCVVWMKWPVPWLLNIPVDSPFVADGLQITFILLPLLFLRSFVGLCQVQGFSYGQYRYLLALSGALVIAVIAAAGLISDPVFLAVTLTLAVLAVLIVFRPPRTAAGVRTDAGARRMSVSLFLSALCRAGSPVHAGLAQLDSSVLSADKVIRQLLASRPSLCAARVTRRSFIWFDQEETTGPALVAICGGALTDLKMCHGEGKRVAGTMLHEWLNVTGAMSLDELIRLFHERFASGFIMDVVRGTMEGKRDASSLQSIRAVLRILSRSGSAGNRNRFSAGAFDMAVYRPGGEPEMLFMMPCDVSIEERVRFSRLVYEAGLTASLR